MANYPIYNKYWPGHNILIRTLLVLVSVMVEGGLSCREETTMV